MPGPLGSVAAVGPRGWGGGGRGAGPESVAAPAYPGSGTGGPEGRRRRVAQILGRLWSRRPAMVPGRCGGTRVPWPSGGGTS